MTVDTIARDAASNLNPLDQAAAFAAAARAAAADGLTWQEFGQLLVALLRLLISSYDVVASMTGPQKKAAVMDGVAMLYDAVADKCVPLAVYPLYLLVRPAVRQLVIAVAAGAVEQLLPLLRSAA